MVHILTRIGAAVVSGVTARVRGGRRMGILERLLPTGAVVGLLVHRRPGLGTACGEARRVSTVRFRRDIAVSTGHRLRILDRGRRPVEHGSLRRLTMAFAAEPAVLPAVPADVAERGVGYRVAVAAGLVR